MLRYLPFAVVSLLAVVSWGWGGHSPWSMLVLELGAVALLSAVLLEDLWRTSPEERASELHRRRAWRKLPFPVRHPRLSSLLRVARLRRTTEVEILPPGHQEPPSDRQPDRYSFAGYRFKKVPVAAPLVLITIWIFLSLVPWNVTWLEWLSPQAFSIRSTADSFLRAGEGLAIWPWSIAAFFTEQSLCLWIAYLALFYVGICVATDPARVKRLSRLFFIAAVAAGLFGLWQWFSGLQGLLAAEPSFAAIRAHGPFGNPNHYAASMEVLLLCSVGWIGSELARLTRPSGSKSDGFLRRAQAMRQESAAKCVLVGLAMMIAALGLIFSLSRSGIAAAVAGLAVFAWLARSGSGGRQAGVIELRRQGMGSAAHAQREAKQVARSIWGFSLLLVAITIWVGMGPVLQRFEGLGDLWEAENGRQQVWVDSSGAVRDFWLTGSGLGSFQHVFPIYRSFGGTHSYTHAHNDYLQLAIELGVPGLLLLLWLVASVSIAARQARRRLQDDAGSLCLHAGCCAAVVAIALHSFTDFSLHLPANAALLSVVLGVVVGFEQKSGEVDQSCP